MAFREYRMLDIKAILAWRLDGHGLRAIARKSGVDRRAVRRYVHAAEAEGLLASSSPSELTDELLCAVKRRVRPGRAGQFGDGWRACEANRELIRGWLEDDGITVVKTHVLLGRRGVDVAYRTLHRFAVRELGFSTRRASTIRVADCAPGAEVQIDFGTFGLLHDPSAGRQRRLKALIFTAVYSRHSFVWPLWTEGFEDVIEGMEAAWRFFGGVFAVVIPDNFKAAVTTADNLSPLLAERFADYAEARGFAVDCARIRSPQDKPRVERVVRYVRENFFAGESFVDLADVRRRAEHWSRVTAGERIHGTTRQQPRMVFEVDEQPALKPVPSEPYDIPIISSAKVGRDQHFSFKTALYSMPRRYVGRRVKLRADRNLVKIWVDDEFVRAVPRQAPGSVHTLPEDIDEPVYPLVTRDASSLQVLADKAGSSVGTYTRRLLDDPRPWSRMRFVYRLLSLVKRYGARPVDDACALALGLDVIDVIRIERIVENATEHPPPKPPAQPAPTTAPRFARAKDHFAARRQNPRSPS